MQLRDIIFFVALLSSIPFGHVVKKVKSPSQKRLICTVAGVFLVLFLNGVQDFWHSFLTIVATYCICKSSRYCILKALKEINLNNSFVQSFRTIFSHYERLMHCLH